MHNNESELNNNYLADLKVIYVVGNSRSGTTMLSRILNNHSKVYSLPELHYFEKYNINATASHSNLLDAIVYLLRIIQKGFYDESPAVSFMSEAQNVYNHYLPDTYGTVYTAVLHYISRKQAVAYICEQTPQNVFYTDVIYSIIPNAYFIHIVRDPRDVLLSQKRKWRRASQGASFIPPSETIRAYFNYHPYTISKIWNAVVLKAQAVGIFTIRFEDIITNSIEALQTVCNACDLVFETGMEQVRITGSSSSKDSDSIGLNKERLYAWKRGGLNSAEIFICQFINSKCIQFWNYESRFVFPNLLLLLLYILYFPVHLLIAIVLNLNRQRNILAAIKRRIKR